MIPPFTRDDVDQEPTPGRQSQLLYRRVKLTELRYDGTVRYEPSLEDLVDDVPAYIAEWLNRRSARLGWEVVRGELYSPLDVPVPDQVD